MKVGKPLGGYNNKGNLSTILESDKSSELIKIGYFIEKLLVDFAEISEDISQNTANYGPETLYWQIFMRLKERGYVNKFNSKNIGVIVKDNLTALVASLKRTLIAQPDREDLRGVITTAFVNLSAENTIEINDAEDFNYLGINLQSGRKLIVHGNLGDYTGFKSYKGSSMVVDKVEYCCAESASGKFVIKTAGEFLGTKSTKYCRIYVEKAGRFAVSESSATMYAVSSANYLANKSCNDCQVYIANIPKLVNTENGKAKIKLREEKRIVMMLKRAGLETGL